MTKLIEASPIDSLETYAFFLFQSFIGIYSYSNKDTDLVIKPIIDNSFYVFGVTKHSC